MTKARPQPIRGRPGLPDPIPLPSRPSLDSGSQQRHLLHKREKIARLLHFFSSPRKRSGLTLDEMRIFFTIGYLGTSIAKDLIQMSPVSYADVASLLGIPTEMLRRKTARLVDIGYVGSASDGIFVKHLDIWCACFSARSSDWAAAYREP